MGPVNRTTEVAIASGYPFFASLPDTDIIERRFIGEVALFEGSSLAALGFILDRTTEGFGMTHSWRSVVSRLLSTLARHRIVSSIVPLQPLQLKLSQFNAAARLRQLL
jgi:hypothetical protein